MNGATRLSVQRRRVTLLAPIFLLKLLNASEPQGRIQIISIFALKPPSKTGIEVPPLSFTLNADYTATQCSQESWIMTWLKNRAQISSTQDVRHPLIRYLIDDQSRGMAWDWRCCGSDGVSYMFEVGRMVVKKIGIEAWVFSCGVRRRKRLTRRWR
ncbi:hypothetical protein B0H19DRAFT_1351482 [Mycena capillaripes]|nr:hypothetical protein B0H19DRAFT_1351482 [Mycena capillaripes]